MSSETRKKLKTVDITCYSSVIQTFADRLRLRNLSAGTLQNYISNLKIFLAWCVLFLTSKKADLLDYDDFRLFIAYLDQEQLEPRTINVYIASLKKFRYYVQQKSWNNYEITFKKYNQKLPKVPSLQQALALVRGSQSCPLRTHLLVCLLLSTGMRISEACSLTYGDLNRNQLLIYIRPGKGRSDRYVPLLPKILIMFEEYCRKTIQACQNAGLPTPGKDSIIFRMDDGITPANCNFLRRDFNKALEMAYFVKEHFTPHSCRHFFALQVYLQKKDLILVKELLGHRSLNATEVYLRLAAAQGFVQDGYTNPLQLCVEQGKHDE